MSDCYHIWVPMTVELEECSRCGLQRAPVFRYAHMQSGEIITTTITGAPVSWPPITEEESNE